jgi:hypothetical protein
MKSAPMKENKDVVDTVPFLKHLSETNLATEMANILHSSCDKCCLIQELSGKEITVILEDFMAG